MSQAMKMLKASVAAILAHPHGRQWSLQGFGMLRTYFDEQRSIRLHVWDDRYAAPGVSTIHDHPWGFRSIVVAGRICNRRYWPDVGGVDYSFQQIQCGEGGGLVGSPLLIQLAHGALELHGQGDSYEQAASEIHESFPANGAVTLVERTFEQDTEHARVFWPASQSWVSAEPRVASAREVDDICSRALARWFR